MRTLNEKRKANLLPFAIVGWYKNPQEVGFDLRKGNIYQAEAMLQDTARKYNAAIQTTDLDLEHNDHPWSIIELDDDKYNDAGML